MSEDTARPGETGDAEELARVRERVDRLLLPPRLPKNVTIEDTGNGVRVQIIGRERGPTDGTVRFDVRYVAECDPSDSTKLAAAVGRSTIVGLIPNPAKNDAFAQTTVSDGQYRSGWFFITAANLLDEISGPSAPVRIGDAVHDRAVPPPVEHLQMSESGEPHDGMTWSAVDIAYRAPNPLRGFNAIEPIVKDYPTRGEWTSFGRKEFNGLAGGSASVKLLLQPARRPGLGTVTASTASAVVTFGGSENALIQVQPGDYLEILGVRAQIKSVDTALQVTLGTPGGASANWPGEDVAAFAAYLFIGKVRIYVRSLSAGLGYEEDFSVIPYGDVVLDAEMSAPNAPTLAVENAGNLIRAAVTLTNDENLERVVLYRGTGAGVAFADCEPIKTWPPDDVKPSATLTYEDTDFTAYEKEQGQTFTYYAVAINKRGQRSAPSAAAQASCRLNSGREGSDPPGKLGLFNRLYNGFIAGTALNPVLASDTSQDTNFPVVAAVDVPGRPYGDPAGNLAGIGRYIGHTRWSGTDGGTGAGGSIFFDQETEVRISAPGTGKAWYLFQEIEAWNSALGAKAKRLKKDGLCCWSVYLARAATATDGIVGIYIEVYNNGAFVGIVPRRYRDSASDELVWATGVSAYIEVAGANLLQDWVRYYGVFKLDSSLGTVKQFRFNVARIGGVSGVVRVCQAMVNDGEEVGVFTANMDLDGSWPTPGDPAGGIGDGRGLRDGVEILVP